jgi:hypothetical protein
MRKIFLILNFQTLIMVLLAVASTYFCQHYGITAKFPLTLIATAIVFPIVFSIGGAYKRREAALDDYSAIKTHGRAIFLVTRDWMETSSQESLDKIRALLQEMLSNMRTMFTADDAEKTAGNEAKIYETFSNMSLFVKTDLRQKGLSSGECSRTNQYLSKMIGAFENIKHVYQYRTPRTLRTFSTFFITILPPLYGPYFAAIGLDYAPGYGLAFVMPVLFAVILVSLDNIQSHLENPFDQIGEDDITINVEKFIESLEDVEKS